MKIQDLLRKDVMLLDLQATEKTAVIDEMIKSLTDHGYVTDFETFKEGILAREALTSTGLGDGIAMPHSKNAAVKETTDLFAKSNMGVDYESLDGQSTDLFFMIAAPEGENNLHLDVLARLSMMLMDPEFKEQLINAKSVDEFLSLIDSKENDKLKAESDKEEAQKAQSNGYRVLAVTACPTGIAHTFMAAEALENKAKDMGISIKVETNGSGGAKNVLTDEEIANAECIIVAADKKVEMARFEGKKVIQTKVANGIHKTEELLNRATSGDAPIYHHAGGSDSEGASSEEGESFGRQLYKHLMNGVSHMLPFVIGGGILIALAFLIDDYNINPANFGKNTPMAALIKTIGETSFGFMLPVLAGYISMSIADRPGLAVGFVGGMLANLGTTYASAFDSSVSVVSGGFLGALFAGFLGGYLVLGLKKIFDKLPQSLDGLKPTLLYPFFGIGLIGLIMIFVNPFFGGINEAITNFLNSMGGTSKVLLGIIVAGMMSIDMGGPFNKAAYVFGTASLASGNYEVMAAVMAGGMVPPLAIALASTFFKNKFTKRERQSALTNYIMGLSFITEGAIPFAAADPLRVIPSCVIGSATAGALTMLFNCELRAPHGGIFVLPVIGNPLGFLGAVVIGSLVGMIMLALLKKKVVE